KGRSTLERLFHFETKLNIDHQYKLPSSVEEGNESPACRLPVGRQGRQALLGGRKGSLKKRH
ncbi:MAG TPA: hypothetical protein VGA80_17295, partial [Flavobacteriaceae bacterium]